MVGGTRFCDGFLFFLGRELDGVSGRGEGRATAWRHTCEANECMGTTRIVEDSLAPSDLLASFLSPLVAQERRRNIFSRRVCFFLSPIATLRSRPITSSWQGYTSIGAANGIFPSHIAPVTRENEKSTPRVHREYTSSHPPPPAAATATHHGGASSSAFFSSRPHRKDTQPHRRSRALFLFTCQPCILAALL